MTGGPVAVRAQPAARIDEAATNKLRRELSAAVKNVRTELGKMGAAGIKPAIGHDAPSVQELLRLLQSNASALGLQDVLKGNNPADTFRSLNRWLNSTWLSQSGLTGRRDNSPLDASVMGSLELRLAVALNQPRADEIARAIVSGVPSVAAPVVPRRVEPTPAPASALSAEKRSEYQIMIQNLEVIARHGANAREKRDAQNHINGLQALLDKADATARDVRTAETRHARLASRLITRSLAAAQRRGATQPPPAEVAPEIQQASVGPVAQLLKELQTLAADPAKKDVANGISNRLSDMWLVGERKTPEGNSPGEGPRWQMFALFKKAAEDLQAGRAAEAQKSLEGAGRLLTSEQEVMKRYGDMALGMARPLLSSVDALPARSALLQAQVKRSEAYGREALKTYLENQIKAYEQYARDNPGRLSADYVSHFFSSMSLFSNAVKNLNTFYSYHVRENGGSPAPECLQAYSVAVGGLTNPNMQTVWVQLSPSVKALIKNQIAGILGKPRGLVTDNDAADFLLRNQRWRHTSLLQGFYASMLYSDQDSSSRKPSSLPAEVRTSLGAIARLRTLGTHFMMEYAVYVAREKEGEQANTERLKEATDFLSRAVREARAAGLPDSATKPLADTANQWIKLSATVPDAVKVKTADSMFDMALGIIAICEAEIRMRNAAVRPASLGANSSMLGQARADLDQARAEFLRAFKVPDERTFPGAVAEFTSLPAYMAGRTILALSPPVLRVSEDNSRYFALQEATNTGVENPTRDQILKAAADGEMLSLRFMHMMKDRPEAGTLLSANLLSRESGRQEAMALLDPRVYRMREFTLHEFSMLVVTPETADTGFASFSESGMEREAVREERSLSQIGLLYQLHSRQALVNKDSTLPSLLRGTNQPPASYGEAQRAEMLSLVEKSTADAPVKAQMRKSADEQYADLRTRVLAISKGTGFNEKEPFLKQVQDRMYTVAADQSKSYSEQRLQLNKLVLAVLDVRIAELENRLDRGIRTTDGVKISDLERSSDPRAFVITRAREALVEAKRLRERFASQVGNNLFQHRTDPKAAIVMVENATASLREDAGGAGRGGRLATTIRDIPKPPVITGEYAITYRIAEETGRQRFNRRDFAFQGRARFSAEITITDKKTRKPVPVSQYEKQEGPLTLMWFVYQTGPLRSGSTSERYTIVVSPAYLSSPEYRENRTVTPVGMVVRDATDTSGRKIGDVVVRVRKTAQANRPTIGPAWEPDLEKGNRVDPDKILYRLVRGTLDPVKDSALSKNLDSVAFRFVGAEAGSSISVPQPPAENLTSTARLMVLEPGK